MKLAFRLFLYLVLVINIVACDGDDIEPAVVDITSVTLNKSNLLLEEGETETLISVLNPNNATNKKVTWISTDANIAVVDAVGKVTALKPGNTTIIVITEDGGKMATCVVTCNGAVDPGDVKVENITLNKKALLLEKGEEETLLASISPENATSKKITWIVSDKNIATVDSNGKVIALKAGNTKVIAVTADGAKIAICEVTVEDVSVTRRTVLVYIAGDNSLSFLVANDLKEIKQGMEKMNEDDVHLLVYVDTRSSAPRLIEFKKNNGVVVENIVKNYDSRNSVGVAETKEVFKDVFSSKEFQAKSYGLVYWSHGDGWIPNPIPASRWVGQDDSNYMNISDLTEILKDAPHFDFILFDACFMQSIEVAYELRAFTDYYIGSPTEIPGPGAVYDVLVPALFATENVALKLGAAYYDPYHAKYDEGKGITDFNWTGGVSVGVLKSAELERLAATTKQVLAGSAGSGNLTFSVFNYDKRSSSSGVGYYDMVAMMKILVTDAAYTAWKQVYDDALIYWKTTPKNYSGFVRGVFSMENTNGVSHYIPSSRTTVNAAYRSTSWYRDAGLATLGW